MCNYQSAHVVRIRIALSITFKLMQRVHLDISIGEHAVDYGQIAAKEKLNELQLRIRQLLDQIEQITKEQAYQRVCNSPHFFQYAM